MMKNLKIGKRLIITFIAVALIASLSGITSIFLIKNVDNTNNEVIYTYAFPQGDIGKAMLALTQCQKTICNIVSFTSAKDIAAQKEEYDRNLKNYTEVYMPTVESTIVTEEGKAILVEIKAAEAEWLRIRDEVLTMGDTTDVVRTQRAQQILVDELFPAFQTLYSHFTDLMTLNVTVGNEKALEATAQANKAITINLLTLIAALGVAAVMGIVVSRGISKPIEQCVGRLDQLSEGDLASPVPEINTKDETGRLADSTKKIVATMHTIISDMSYGLSQIGSGNFTVDSQAPESYVGDFKPLADSMYKIIANLTDTLSQINLSSDQVASGSDQVASGAQALSQGATEQASSVEELAATINDISHQISESAEHAAEASDKAKGVGTEITESNERMNAMLSAMSDISTRSNEIGKIIKTIEDIAFQTNILALNAAVEAARAGSAGKGFAVVADEVRNLASKSAQASKNTAALIEGSLSAVENGTKIAGETAQSLIGVVNGVQEVADTISKISVAATDEAESIAQVTTGIEQISAVVQTNSATAEESAAASEELSGQASILRELVGKFQLKNSDHEAHESTQQQYAAYDEPTFSSSSAGKY